jgi:hypothetical protein
VTVQLLAGEFEDSCPVPRFITYGAPLELGLSLSGAHGG